MPTPTTKIPRLPKNRREWLIFIALYAVAGAVFSSPGRGPVAAADAAWQKWAGLVAEWVVYGALIGAVVQWLTGQSPSYRHAIVSLAIMMPVLLVFVELVRVLAAWYTGGWERNVTSAGIGALVGIALSPVIVLLFVAVGKVLALVLPSATAHSGSDSASPG